MIVGAVCFKSARFFRRRMTAKAGFNFVEHLGCWMVKSSGGAVSLRQSCPSSELRMCASNANSRLEMQLFL